MFGEKFEAYRRVVPYWLPFRGLTFQADASDRQTLNDLSIYETYAETWWTGQHRWLRTLHNLVPARLAHFDLLVDAWQGCRVLDLGCGGGFMSEALAGRGAVVTGIDPAQPALAIARSHAKSRGLSIIYLHGTGEAIPVKDATFDQVVCVDVLEHVEDIDTVLAEVHRVLRPGGLFLFDTINRNWLARLVIVTFGERILRLLPRGTHDPAKFITPDELRLRLIQQGFTVHRFVGLGPTGLDRRFDFTFGLLPTTTIMYMGSATALSRDN
ncbi:MAG: 3-demethylubiquinone-9 3-O-methyltransferase [Planctomycetes bacterium]|nr:3-demethylubiquinone-9 3-O-methyltransferase [Planctomycetota bacterium]